MIRSGESYVIGAKVRIEWGKLIPLPVAARFLSLIASESPR